MLAFAVRKACVGQSGEPPERAGATAPRMRVGRGGGLALPPRAIGGRAIEVKRAAWHGRSQDANGSGRRYPCVRAAPAARCGSVFAAQNAESSICVNCVDDSNASLRDRSRYARTGCGPSQPRDSPRTPFRFRATTSRFGGTSCMRSGPLPGSAPEVRCGRSVAYVSPRPALVCSNRTGAVESDRR